MTKLEVCRKLDALCRGNVAVSDEDHVRNRTAWKDGSADQLADQVYTAMLIRDSHHYADWDEENRTNTQCQK